MDQPTSTPRRPIVPGPSGIAAKAIAVREAQRKSEPLPTYEEAREKANAAPLRQPAPILPFQGVGNLAKGIAGVMSEVGTITKSGYNKFHGYHYATLQDLLFAITPLMGRHGVVVVQNEIERTLAENRVMVTYEFSIFHTSGEIWPEKPRFTGMCIGRNSKGDYDDKAINKAHSAARKYFLLSLFQVPSGDFDDADEGPASASEKPKPHERANPVKQPEYAERHRTVPGPGPATSNKQPIVAERPLPEGPYKIGFTPGMTADVWASAYVKAVGMATTPQEISEWDGLNDTTLQRLSDKYPEVYEQVRAVAEARLNQIVTIVADPPVMPDPKEDPGAALNWVAQGLVDSKTLPDAEAFWNQYVMPREADFDPVDWELLLEEFKRNEVRLTPPDQPDAD